MRIESSTFYDSNGSKSHLSDIEWNSTPTLIHLHQHIYIIGVTLTQIEIKRMETGELVSILNMENVLNMTFGNPMFAFNSHLIWKLDLFRIDQQMEELISLKEYINAKNLVPLLESDEIYKIQQLKRIQILFAQHTFKEFNQPQKALELLNEIKSSPLHALQLLSDFFYPSFHPHNDQQQVPVIVEQKTLTLFMDYLSRQRAGIARRLKQLERMNSEFNNETGESSITYTAVDTYEGEGFDSEFELLELSKVVDTALLYIYVELNHPLLRSLLRVSNYCDEDKAERLLSTKERWEDLIYFYKGKQHHIKALQVLKSEKMTNSVVFMSEYLKNLDINTHQSLIVEYSQWVISKDVYLGIQIYVDRFDEMNSETQNSIINKIEELHPDFSLLFLDYCVRFLQNTSPETHEKFIQKYLFKKQESKFVEFKVYFGLFFSTNFN